MTWASRNIGATRAGIAIIVLLIWALEMAVLAFVPIPPENREAFAIMIGGLNTALGAIVQWFFASSRSRVTT